MKYLCWNDLLAAHFFKPESSGRRVYLFATQQLLDDLNPDGSSNLEDFVEAVKTGPPWATSQGLCQRALQAYKSWRVDHPRDYPPYIGYLALFVIAAGLEGDFSPNAYYPKLRYLLREPVEAGQYPSFDRMLDLWDDLETWSATDKAGELGVFRAFISGGWIHVGLPISQTFLTERDRSELSIVFAEAGLDPTAPPSEKELLKIISDHARGRLSPSTGKLIRNVDGLDNDLLQVLSEIFLEELEGWDGSIEEHLAPVKARQYASLAICASVDRVSGRVTCTLRCKTKKEFPEDGLQLINSAGSLNLTCAPGVSEWSSVLLAQSGVPYDGALADWANGLCMREIRLGWQCALSPSTVRLLVNGSAAGLSGLIEVKQLPADRPFYVLADGACADDIENWGAKECKAFVRIEIRGGLPPGWKLYHAGSAISDSLVSHLYPILTLPHALRLRLVGGLRINRGNCFFDFSRPRIAIEGPSEGVTLICDDIEISLRPGCGVVELPEQVAVDKRIRVLARRGQKDVARPISLELVSDAPLPTAPEGRVFDVFGNIIQPKGDGVPAVSGAYVEGVRPPDFAFSTFLEVSESRRVVFVGRQPGQIVDWPSEPLPTDWSPVWAIPFHRRGRAIYCASDLSSSCPSCCRVSDRKRVKAWKKVLWHWRKRIQAPSQQAFSKLWQEYQDVARSI